MKVATPTLALLMLIAGLYCGTAMAGVTTREQTVEGHKQLVLENELVRLVVVPDPGGTAISFIDKRTQTNYVAGGDSVLKGRLIWGWKDFYPLAEPEQLGKRVFTLPYIAEFRQGKGYKSIYVSCETEGRRFEREMRLSEASGELATFVKVTNISDQPLPLQCRYHTYSTLDDGNAEHSCILLPGPGGEIRKCFIGSGYNHQFFTNNGFLMAVNYKDRTGLWMTFNRTQTHAQITWTDYNYARKGPTRGRFIAEPLPDAILAEPGESVAYECTFYPFIASDTPQTIPLGLVTDPDAQKRARQFLAQVLPNLNVIGPYTMTPGDPPAGQVVHRDENRFNFSHRRRDRFALRTWGILDAMFNVPGVQDQKIRCRYYAHLFDHVTTSTSVSFRMRMIDASGQIAREQTRQYTIDPAANRVLDVRDDIDMTGLADGEYQFILDGFVEGEKEPVHTYKDHRHLVGQAKPAYEKWFAQLQEAPLVERPFVAALRQIALPASSKGNVNVPIGVEDGSGLSRKAWPVSCGVPFAQGMIAKDAKFELLSPDGKAVPAQVTPMATWLDGSIKWLLVDFPADVPANSHVFYTLRNTTQNQNTFPLLATQSNGQIQVTGNPSTVEAGKLFGLFGPKDLWWEDGDGQKYYFRLQGPEAGMEIQENGINRAVIKATGWYYNEHDRPMCLGELRLEHYRGKPFVKLYHSVTFAGSPWTDTLGSYGVRFQLPDSAFNTATVTLDGRVSSGPGLTLLQTNADYAQLTLDASVTRGARSIGAVRLSKNVSDTVTFYERDFWQMAPKKIQADAASGTVTFSYWPSEAGVMSFLPREDGLIASSSGIEAVAMGMSRTHEIIIDYGESAELPEYEKLFSEPVVAIVPPRYMAGTNAMLHLQPYDPENMPRLEHVISDTIDFYQSQRELFGWYGAWDYGALRNVWRPGEYQWLNFGRYGWILNEQNIVESAWLCYIRSGDRKYLKFARVNTQHLRDVATIRWNPAWPEYVGLSRRHHEQAWTGGGDTGHSMLDPFLDEYYVTGYKPAWDAAKRMAEAMAKTTSGTWRYLSNPVAGLSRMYLDTQNPYYKEQADRIWNTLCFPEKNNWWWLDHGGRMVMWYSQINPQCKDLWLEWAADPKKKNRLNEADILMYQYLQTGDISAAKEAWASVPQSMPYEITQHVLKNLRTWCYIHPLPDQPAKP